MLNKNLNYHLSKETLNLAANGVSKAINRDHPDFDRLVAMLREGNEDGLEKYLTEFKQKVETPYKKLGFTVEEGRVQVNGEFLPGTLGERVKNHADQGLPVDRLLKFWGKLKKNSSYRSVQALFEFAERNNLPFTVDGDVVAYKAITKDWKDKYSETIDNSVGATVEKDRNSVDDDFRVACSTGLHVGGHSYVRGFGNDADRYIEVSFSPEDVVSVPCNEDKIRVCRYVVLREISKNEVVAFKGEHYTNLDENDEDDDFENNYEEEDFDYDDDGSY